jgi:hypothetical protein
MDSTVLTPLLANLIQALVAILVVVVTYYIKQWAIKLVGEKGLAQATEIARLAVDAIDQIATTQGWDNERRKAEATAFVMSLGTKYGINLTEEQWSTLIEAAVKATRDYEQPVVTSSWSSGE